MDIHGILQQVITQNQGLELAQGTVTATASGSVSVKIAASTTSISGIKYLSSYTPTVNDVVFMLIDGKDVLILGKCG